MAMGIVQALKLQRGSIRELAMLPQQQIMAMAQRQEIPAPMVPVILNEKARMQQESQAMQAAAQMQGQQPQTVTERNMQAIGASEQQEAMRRRMAAGVGSLPVEDETFQAAGGGIVAFEDGGPVESYRVGGLRLPRDTMDNFGDVGGVDPTVMQDLAEYQANRPEEEVPAASGEFDVSQALPRYVQAYQAATKPYRGAGEAEKSLQDYIAKYGERAAAQAEQDEYMDRIKIGARIMAGTSPYAFTNIGQGISEALPDIQRGIAARRAAELNMLKARAELERGRREEGLKDVEGGFGLLKEAADLERTSRKERGLTERERIKAGIGSKTLDLQYMNAYVKREMDKIARGERKPATEDELRVEAGDKIYDFKTRAALMSGAAALGGVRQRERATDVEADIKREEQDRRDRTTATQEVSDNLRKASHPDALRYREILDTQGEAAAEAYKSRLINNAVTDIRRGRMESSAAPTKSSGGKQPVVGSKNTALPMPRSQKEAVDGQVYSTPRGPARWNSKTGKFIPVI